MSEKHKLLEFRHNLLLDNLSDECKRPLQLLTKYDVEWLNAIEIQYAQEWYSALTQKNLADICALMQQELPWHYILLQITQEHFLWILKLLDYNLRQKVLSDLQRLQLALKCCFSLEISDMQNLQPKDMAVIASGLSFYKTETRTERFLRGHYRCPLQILDVPDLGLTKVAQDLHDCLTKIKGLWDNYSLSHQHCCQTIVEKLQTLSEGGQLTTLALVLFHIRAAHFDDILSYNHDWQSFSSSDSMTHIFYFLINCFGKPFSLQYLDFLCKIIKENQDFFGDRENYQVSNWVHKSPELICGFFWVIGPLLTRKEMQQASQVQNPLKNIDPESWVPSVTNISLDFFSVKSVKSFYPCPEVWDELDRYTFFSPPAKELEICQQTPFWDMQSQLHEFLNLFEKNVFEKIQSNCIASDLAEIVDSSLRSFQFSWCEIIVIDHWMNALKLWQTLNEEVADAQDCLQLLKQHECQELFNLKPFIQRYTGKCLHSVEIMEIMARSLHLQVIIIHLCIWGLFGQPDEILKQYIHSGGFHVLGNFSFRGKRLFNSAQFTRSVMRLTQHPQKNP